MKKYAVLCLSIVVVLLSLVGCDFGKEVNESNIENHTGDDKLTTEEKLINVIDHIAACRPTLDEFKQMYPNCRTIRESIDGSYSYIDVSTPDIPDVLFSFERYFGENGYSKIYLTSINASASLLLPEYMNMSIEYILKNEGEHAWYDKSEHESISYGDVYIYRDNFCYYIQGYVHPYKLGTDGIHIKLYNDSFFSLTEENALETYRNAESFPETLKSLVASKCTLEQFKTTFDGWYVVDEKEGSVVIACTGLNGAEFEFSTIFDNLGNRKTVLSSISASADILMHECVGMERYELIEAGMEMPRNNDYDYHSLFLYEENYCLFINLYTDGLEYDTTVHMVPYTDSWIRPW